MRVGFVLRSAEIKPLFFDLFRSNQTKTISGKRARTRVSPFPAAPSSNSLFLEWTNGVQHSACLSCLLKIERKENQQQQHTKLFNQNKSQNPFQMRGGFRLIDWSCYTVAHVTHSSLNQEPKKTASLFTRAPELHQLSVKHNTGWAPKRATPWKGRR